MKIRIAFFEFFKNPSDYLSDPDEVLKFFEALENTDGWMVGTLGIFENDSERGCLTAKATCWTDWGRIA